MMRQKLITLDPTSWERAMKKPNFSAWVRQQLQIEADLTPKGTVYSFYKEYMDNQAKEESE